MSADFEKILQSLDLQKHERLEKDSETYKIMERVFDRSTLLTLYHMINRGVFDFFQGVISTGKEANIFCAVDKAGNFVAVKVYRIATSNFKNMYRYLAGDPRFRDVSRERRRVVFSWASREFKNMRRAREAGVPVPKPLDQEKNVLAMEFVGEGGVPYPRMKDDPPQNPEKVFEKLLEGVRLLYQKARLIHSDLSEYNVLLTPDPVLIDFSLGTDVANPMASELLQRDLKNLTKFFRKQGVETPEIKELVQRVTEENP